MSDKNPAVIDAGGGSAELHRKGLSGDLNPRPSRQGHDMSVGFLGLGRLGLPIAAILSQHHTVTGYDPDPSTAERLKVGHPWEEGLDEYLNDQIALAPSIEEATHDADVVVVCVQTPHHPRLDGTYPDDGTREPFDLSFVEAALSEIRAKLPVVLMSTVLPGDTRRLAEATGHEIIYSPAFPAMGTTVADVLSPEFVLAGVQAEGHSASIIEKLWAPIVPSGTTFIIDSWETIELAKVGYNTFVGMKLAATNTLGWLAHETGADGQRVMDIIKRATRRIVSPAYMNPGLGDGGACHPRDLIAMSWLALRHGVDDLFSDLITQRELHSEWVARQALALADTHDLADIVILGSAYKANSTLVDGSPALLMARQTGWPVTDDPSFITEPSVVVIGVPHDRYRTLDLPEGSVVCDPWGHVEGPSELMRVWLGRHPS